MTSTVTIRYTEEELRQAVAAERERCIALVRQHLHFSVAEPIVAAIRRGEP